MEMKCLECGNPVPQTPGKRKKEYCNSTCRTVYWKKKKQAESGKQKRKPGRPPKAIDPIKIQAKIAQVKQRIKDDPRAKMRCVTSIPSESFMGHPIPPGIKGIDLSIWKAEIKEKEHGKK